MKRSWHLSMLFGRNDFFYNFTNSKRCRKKHNKDIGVHGNGRLNCAIGVTTILRKKKLYLPGHRMEKEVNFITRQSCFATRGVEKVKIIFPGKICDYQRAERKLPRHTPTPTPTPTSTSDGPWMEREGKLRNALGRQVGRQAGRYWALYFHKLIFTRQYTRPCPLLYGPRKYSGPPGIGWQGGRVLSLVLYPVSLSPSPFPSLSSCLLVTLFLSFYIPHACLPALIRRKDINRRQL